MGQLVVVPGHGAASGRYLVIEVLECDWVLG